jgi:ATP adenylyltransferase
VKNVLWAPWRAEYIHSFGKKRKKGCIFCLKPGRKKDRENLILFRGRSVFVIMNRYPYNNGHLMVVPCRHAGDPTELSAAENHALWDALLLCKTAIQKLFKPAGFNIGMNLGRCAGAGIEGHCHIHIVPRWNGDTNFMPVFGDVKVVSEGLFQTYDRLKPLFK